MTFLYIMLAIMGVFFISIAYQVIRALIDKDYRAKLDDMAEKANDLVAKHHNDRIRCKYTPPANTRYGRIMKTGSPRYFQ